MTEITIPDLTTKQLNGTGVFDELMQTVQLRLDEQYRDNKIAAGAYSQLYLGSLQAVLPQSIAYLMQRQQADKQADLIAAQIVQTEKQNEKIDKELELIDEQILKMQADIELTNQQIAISKVQEQNLIEEQEKTIAEVSLIKQNLTNAETSNTNLLKQQVKSESETDLLNQKRRTELAQISDTVDGEIVGGTIGTQKDLYGAQKEGFLRNAEQKLAKILTDSWIVRRTTDDGTIAPAGISDADISEVMAIAKAGIK